jgi:hypothetical protein
VTYCLEGSCSIQLSYGCRFSRHDGRSERIRTSDPLLPKQVRYQAALRSAAVGNHSIATLFGVVNVDLK